MPLIDAEHSTFQRCVADGYARYRLGRVDLALSSDLDDVTQDIDALYGACRWLGGDTEQTVRIDVRAERSHRFARPTYTVYGDGQELWTTRRVNEVLPYVEWGVNWRVISSRTDFLQVHAATLAHDGCGMMLAAKAGSGKSTLAAALLARGWSYLSDEFALIEPVTLRAHPFPKALCIKSGSFDVLEGLGLPLWRRGHYVKVLKGRVGYLSPHRCNAAVETEGVPIRHVILPEYVEGAAPSLHPISRAEAAFALMGIAFNRDAFGPDAVKMLSNVVRGATCFRLRSGAIEPTCELLESVLGVHAPSTCAA